MFQDHSHLGPERYPEGLCNNIWTSMFTGNMSWELPFARADTAAADAFMPLKRALWALRTQSMVFQEAKENYNKWGHSLTYTFYSSLCCRGRENSKRPNFHPFLKCCFPPFLIVELCFPPTPNTFLQPPLRQPNPNVSISQPSASNICHVPGHLLFFSGFAGLQGFRYNSTSIHRLPFSHPNNESVY